MTSQFGANKCCPHRKTAFPMPAFQPCPGCAGALGDWVLPDAVGASRPSALPKTQVFHFFSCFCFVTTKSLWRRRALQAIPAGKNTSIRIASAAGQGDSIVLRLHCLVLRCLQILKLSLIIAQNPTNNVSRAHKAPPWWSAGLERAGRRCGAPACGASPLPAGPKPWRGHQEEAFGLSFCSCGLSGCFACLFAFTGVFSPRRLLSEKLVGRRRRWCDSAGRARGAGRRAGCADQRLKLSSWFLLAIAHGS